MSSVAAAAIWWWKQQLAEGNSDSTSGLPRKLPPFSVRPELVQVATARAAIGRKVLMTNGGVARSYPEAIFERQVYYFIIIIIIFTLLRSSFPKLAPASEDAVALLGDGPEHSKASQGIS